jgi:hypothetical protein
VESPNDRMRFQSQLATVRTALHQGVLHCPREG